MTRIVAGHTRVAWTVIHVPSCKDIGKITTMVDDVACVYETFTPNAYELARTLRYMPTQINRANKIRIIPAKSLILIDPVDDPDEDATDSEQMQPGTPQFEAWVNEDAKENSPQ